MASIANLHNEEKLVEDTAEYIKNIIDTRFDPDMPQEWKEALAEYGLDMFEAGAAWSDATSHRDTKAIITH